MNYKTDVLLPTKENLALTNVDTLIENNLTPSAIVSSLHLDSSRRCSSLPIFISENMYCDWNNKSTNSSQSRFITGDSNHQSVYLADTSTLNFDPFNLGTEAKSLQELQTEVDALIEFRNIVIETFPDLKTKIVSMHSAVSSSTLQRHQSKKKRIRKKAHVSLNAHKNSVINRAEIICEAPPSYVSRSRSNSNCCRKEPKSGDVSGSTVQDSGFSTETTSSKDGYSALTYSGGLQANNMSNLLVHGSDDELLNLLDVIFRKTLKFRDKLSSMPQFECDKHETYVSPACIPKVLRFNSNYPLKENLVRLRKERDKLLLNVAELESEIMRNRIQISNMESKLKYCKFGNTNFKNQSKAPLNQDQQLNFQLLRQKCDSPSRKHIQPTHKAVVKCQCKCICETSVNRQSSRFVAHESSGRTDKISSKNVTDKSFKEDRIPQQPTTSGLNDSEFDINSEHLNITDTIEATNSHKTELDLDFVSKSRKKDTRTLGKLNGILSPPKRLCRVRETDSNKIAAILLEANPLELQRHLLTLSVKNQVRRSFSQRNGPNSKPQSLENKTSLLLHEVENTSDYRNNSGLTCSLEQSTNSDSKCIQAESVNGENIIDSIRSHDSRIQTLNEYEKKIQSAKRPKPSKIPRFDSKPLLSSKADRNSFNSVNSSPVLAIHKSLSLSTGNISFKNNISRLNKQDSLTLKTRRSPSSISAHFNFVPARNVIITSALSKTHRKSELDSFFPANNLAKPSNSAKTNENILTHTKIDLNTQHDFQTNNSNVVSPPPQIISPDQSIKGKMVELTKKNMVLWKDSKPKTDADKKIRHLKQPGVQLLIGEISNNGYKSPITNINSLSEDEPFNDEDVGKVRNLRSALLGWLKI